MEQCFDIMIPCDDFEINFLQNVFQTNKYPYCLYMMTGNPYFIFLPLKSRSNYVLFETNESSLALANQNESNMKKHVKTKKNDFFKSQPWVPDLLKIIITDKIFDKNP